MQTSTLTYRCPHCEHLCEFENINDGDIVTCTNPECRREFHARAPEVEPERGLIIPGQAMDGQAQEESRNGQTKADESTSRHESASDQVVAVYPTPMVRRHPFIFAGYVLLVILGFVGLMAAMTDSSVTLGVIGGLMMTAGIVLLGHWWWKVRNTKITLTRKSLIIHNGLMSQHTTEIHHASIREIHIYQTFTCRWLDTGAMYVEWGDEPDEKFFIESVYNPQGLVKQIRELGGQ